MTSREQLEQAMAALEGQRAILSDAVVDASIAALRQQLSELAPPVERQRKLVTVLFADVSGFTALSEQMDVEDVNNAMNELWRQLDAIIVEHNGAVDKHMGDGLMAVWGVAATREDDPESAIRAALTMQEAITDWSINGERLAMRIGINTGLVLLSDVGDGSEYTAVGDTVNTASRLEKAAPTNGVLITHDVYRHVRGVFAASPLEPLAVKGKADPIQTYHITEAKPRAFRLGGRGVEGIETKMVGRDLELRQLQEALQAAIEDSELHLVAVEGEAGLGKSRLLYEYENWVDLLPDTIWVFKGRASQEMSQTPFALLRDLFTFRFQILDSDPLALARQKLEEGMREFMGTESQESAYLIGHLLGFDFSHTLAVQSVGDDARLLRERAFTELSRFFTAAARTSPAHILLEDVHWADDGSLDLVDYLIRACPDSRLFIVALARPTLWQRRPLWGEGQLRSLRLQLRPLSNRDSRQLVRDILRQLEELPQVLQETIVSNAEGNPYYVEELIKMLIEDGVIIAGGEKWQLVSSRLVSLQVPPTLTGVLQARLDQLSPLEREILQQASVVGRVFWDSALSHIRGSGDQEAITASLAALRVKELIFQRETSTFTNAVEYIFKHTILREVTYENVLKARRRPYHQATAEWLANQSGSQSNAYAQTIAVHYETAGHLDLSAHWYAAGASYAVQTGDYFQAIQLYDKVLALTKPGQQDKTAAINANVYHIRLTSLRERGRLLNVIGQLQEALAAFEQYRVEADSSDKTVDALTLIGNQQAYLGLYQQAFVTHQEALSIAEKNNDSVGRAHAIGGVGFVLSRNGRFEEALHYLQQALTLFEQIGNKIEQTRGWNRLAVTHMYMGRPDKAIESLNACLAIVREIGLHDPIVVTAAVNALTNLGECYQQLYDMEQALSHHQQALELLADRGLPGMAAADTRRNIGVEMCHLGRLEEGMVYLYESLALTEETIQPDVQPQVLYSLALAEVERGELEAGWEYAQRLQGLTGENKAHQAMALHALGLCHKAQGQIEEAERLWQQAVTLASESLHQYLLWQLYAAMADAANNPAIADGHWRAAAEIIQQIAAPLENEALRQTFLTAAPIRAILQRFD